MQHARFRPTQHLEMNLSHVGEAAAEVLDRLYHYHQVEKVTETSAVYLMLKQLVSECVASKLRHKESPY